MNYEHLVLPTSTEGLTIRKPNGRKDTAVIENLTLDYDQNRLLDIIIYMQQIKIKNLVIDFSKYPPKFKPQAITYLYGFSSMADINLRYTGVNSDEILIPNSKYSEFLNSKASKTIDDAIEELIK